MPPVTPDASVLLVESNDASRSEIGHTLRTLGYHVYDYANGEAAVTFVRNHAGPLALLVTVTVMGQLDDTQLAAAIRLMRPKLPVLHMSNRSREAVIAAADSTIALALSA